MKRITLIILVSILLLISCASMEFSNMGYQVQDGGKLSKQEISLLGLKVSAQENISLESNYFGIIDFSFVNTSQEWIYIKNITLDFGNDMINSNIKIISGKDIYAWKESTILRNKIDEYNMNLFLGSLALAGSVMSASGNKNVSAAGDVFWLGATTSLTVKEISDSYRKINYSAIFPQNHLLSGDIIIPPGLFVKKWIVLNTKNHDKTGLITGFDLEYKTEKGVVEKVRIKLKERENIKGVSGGRTIWQEDLFSTDFEKILNFGFN